ncbi:hypothetical protein MKW94_020604 [Papaver nudicaule]|uniref:Uncharacterized protein n=1 Tax=Papaver nudicaule TaxID=74823 RepID=A0AA41S9D4_PAPNU|nr:hypothetical protein [Papaver nudicaule]
MAGNILSISVLLVTLVVLVGVSGVYSRCYPGDEIIRLPYAGNCLECEAQLRKKATKHFTLWRFMCHNYVSCEGCYTRSPPSPLNSPPPPSPNPTPPPSPSPPPPFSSPLFPPTPRSMSSTSNNIPPQPSSPPPQPSNTPPPPVPSTPSPPSSSLPPPASTPPLASLSSSNFSCAPADQRISLILKSCGSCDVCASELSKNQPRGRFISNFSCNKVGSSIICEGCYGKIPHPSSTWESSVCPEEMILRDPSEPDKKRCRYKLAEFYE